MENAEIWVEVKIIIDDSEYQEIRIDSIQAYHGDEYDRRFGGTCIERTLDGKKRKFTVPVKLTKLRNKKLSKLKEGA
jgi:hypothetical protein